MKVVALKSFGGNGYNATQGHTLDVDPALAKIWIAAGLVEKSAAATTSTTPTPPAPKTDEAKGSEVVKNTKVKTEKESK